MYRAGLTRPRTLTFSWTESSASSLLILQRKRLSKDEVQTVDTSVKVVNGKGKHRQVSVTRRQSSIQRRSSSLLQIVEDAQAGTRTESPYDFDDLHLQRCASPTEEECDGYDCGSSLGHEAGPNVVCAFQTPRYGLRKLTVSCCRWR